MWEKKLQHGIDEKDKKVDAHCSKESWVRCGLCPLKSFESEREKEKGVKKFQFIF